MLIKNNRGFSLVELMVVVAIIGLLAAIGIPQYAKFQAKARTSEARAALSMLYTAEQSFFGEWRLYTVDLRNIGFGVTGTNLRYITGFQSGTACTNYVTTGGAPTESTAITNTWSDGTNVNTGSQAATFATFTAGAGTRTLQATTCVATAGAQTFTGASIGDPRNNFATGTAVDAWTINQNKLLNQSVVGY